MLGLLTSASAQLHETLPELTQRFGAPAGKQEDQWLGSQEYEFHWQGWTIRASLIDGNCHAISYTKPGAPRAALERLLVENGAGYDWLGVGQMMTSINEEVTPSKQLHFPRSDYTAYLVWIDQGVRFKSDYWVGLEQALRTSNSMVAKPLRFTRKFSRPEPSQPDRTIVEPVPAAISPSLNQVRTAPLPPVKKRASSSFEVHPAVVFGVVFLLFILSLLCREPWGTRSREKGSEGERKVRSILRQLNPTIYHCFHDIYLPRADCVGSTQIDHLVLSPHGIFVIETKNWSGWIFGSPAQREWTQAFPKSKRQIQNPLYQNDLHVRSARAFLRLPIVVFHSLVFMVGDAKFKTPMPANVLRGGFVERIRSVQITALDEETLRQAVNHLKEWIASPEHQKMRRNHVSFLDSNHGMLIETSAGGASKG